MICIYCLHPKTRIANSRPHKKRAQVWRRHRCNACERSFTTYERPSLEDIDIIGRDGQTQKFAVGTLAISLYHALDRLDPRAAQASFELAATVELALIRRYDVTVPITTSAIADEAYQILSRYHRVAGMHYGAAYGL